jgi:adenine-specific DNA-methyltransferase
VWETDAIEHDRALNDGFVALRASYAGQVKCIYTDPPSTTGNRDFVYNDRFVDEDHAWHHSMWFGFMARRLSLPKDLLAPGGAIDENEACNLKLLLGEEFGPDHEFVFLLLRARWAGTRTAAGFSPTSSSA